MYSYLTKLNLNEASSFKYFFTKFRKSFSERTVLKQLKLSEPWKGQEVNEGDGALVYRVIGINKVSDIDPFLMLDYFQKLRLPGGFPDHPHRGFETVTYLTEGKVFHEDFKGHKDAIEEGDIQWMSAGKGIVHAEMPYSFTKPTCGFQLWINLSKSNKMMEPHYQEIRKDKFPVVTGQNYSIKLIAGKVGDVEGACKSTTPTSYFDVNLEPNSELTIPVGKGNSGFVFLFEGNQIEVNNEKKLKKMYALRLDSSDTTDSEINFKSDNSKCRFLLIFARPLKEPIAKYGPFVMSTRDELVQAFEDYQNAKNGFEHRLNWESEIQYMVNRKNDL